MKAKALALVALLLCAPSLVEAVPAPVVIKNDPGGRLQEFVERYDALSAGRRRVVIDGACVSACTLIFGRIPNDRVCVTPRASFGFHSASMVSFDDHGHIVSSQFSILGTRTLTWRYPPAVRAAIRRRGWDMASPHPEVIRIPASELGVYQPCGA